MTVTQAEMARRLGVSQTLVSRALSGRADEIGAAAATVGRIRQAASAWGYRPSAAALTLRGAPSRTLGVIVKDFDDPFFGHIVGALQHLAHRAQYALVLTSADADDGGRIALAPLARYRPDGVLVLGSDLRPGGLDALGRSVIPVVQIGAGPADPRVRQVCMDQAAGLRDLVAYLTGLGHRAIGYIGRDTRPNRRREERLQAALREAGLPAAHAVFTRGDRSAREAGVSGMRRILEGGARKRPTAVIAAEDVIAQAALRALHEAGQRVPADMSLAGVDDIPGAAMAIPALTTIRQPVAAMVRLAFKMVTSGQPHGTEATTLVRPELVIRESCAAPPAWAKKVAGGG